MPILHRDIETFSTLNLTKTGPWRYAGDASTGVWCVAYAVDDGPVQIWAPGQSIPQEFQIAATDPDWLIVAHNDAFETAIETRLLGPRYGWPLVPIARHRDTMAMALANALPGGLDKAAAALGLELRKDAEGRRLMQQMAKPRVVRAGDHDDPSRLERLKAYCARDVEVERALYQRLPPLSDAEQALWALDAEINRRGFAVDVALAKAAHAIAGERRTAIDREISELTGGRITSAMQFGKIEAFLKERGHAVESIGKRSVAAMLAHGPDADIAQLLRLRQEAAKASAGKLATLLDLANDNRLHDTLRFHGAATGRWSGSRFQPQNLSRTTPADLGAAMAAVLSGELERVTKIGPPLAVIGSLSRAMICAEPGNVLASADYSAIESRVFAWLAGEHWKLSTYEKFDATGHPTLEPYCVTASRILGRAVTSADENGRQVGKLTDLAFGYGGGAGAFNRIAPDAGFSAAEIEQFKRQWRAAHPHIVRYWGDLHRALLRAVRGRNRVTFKNLSAEMRSGNLYLRLPSGRDIVYPEARIEPGPYDSDQIMFKDSALGKWHDARGWHGTFVENVVQAIARDLLAAAMVRLEASGYLIVLCVHDEIVAEVPEDFGSVEDFARIMTELPAWAEGLPLVAKASRRQRYAKDAHAHTAVDIIDVETHVDVDREDEPATQADIDELNIGLQREGIEPISTWSTPILIEVMDSPHSNGHDFNTEPGADGLPQLVIPGCERAGDDHEAHGAQHHQQTNGAAGAPPSTDPELGPYIYQNPRGGPHAKVVRTPNGRSRFTQQYWTGAAWASGMPKHKLPYRLPELLAADPADWVCIMEGEKDSVNVAKLGFVATTNPNGAKGWNSAKLVPYFAHLSRIAILEDNDTAGRDRTKRILKTLRVLDPAPDVRVVSFPELPDGGDVSDWLAQDQGRGRAELLARIEAVPTGGELDEWDAGDLLGQGLPPPRQWLYGKQLCRRFASSLVAPGDIGKTTMRLTQAIELAAGHELLGHRIYQRCRVLVVSLEDDRAELQRRLLAICQYHHIDPTELKGWLFCADLNGAKLVEEVDGERLLGELEPMLRKAIERRQPDLVILDPFVKLHALDENSNPDMDFVCSQLVGLAQTFNIAIDSPAHTRKGQLTAGDSDNRRGASAQRDAGRLDYTLTAMSEDEAKQFGIDLEERKSYVRLDRAKANIVRAIKATWYRLVSVSLGNVTALYPEGDEVQALEVWMPPDAWVDLDASRVNQILDKIDAGLPDGNRYSGAPSATKRAAWPIIIAEVPEKAEAQAREIIKAWLKTGLLLSREYENPSDRKKAEGLYVDPAKRPTI